MKIVNFIESYNETGEMKHRIGDFTLKYHSTDAWRGYYEVVPSKKS